LGLGCVEFGQIRLIGLEFLRSAACEGQNIEGKNGALLSFKVA